MKLKEAIQRLDSKSVIQIAEGFANETGIRWTTDACFVFSAIVRDSKRAPGNIGTKKDNEVSVIRKWVEKYKNGYENRPTQRVSNPPGTVADPIISKIIGARIERLTIDELNKISYAHRLGMSAENILGLMLEEYLSENLKEYGWHCAWGETVKSVDFVHEDARLMQIKNRSNSENSSSKSVRDGTEIIKCYRINANKIEYKWDVINKVCDTAHLSEELFEEFVRETLKLNPGCLAVEQKNPWR